MDVLVPACEERLSRLDEARLQEFEVAMERTFMPYIRTQLKIFDAGGGFSAIPGIGNLNNNNSEQGGKALSPHTDNETPTLEDSDSFQASMSTNVAFDEDLVSCDRSDAPCNSLERINMILPQVPPSCLSDMLSSIEVPLRNINTFLIHNAAKDSFFTSADEMSIDFFFKSSTLSSIQLNEYGREESRQVEDVPADLPGTYLKESVHQRGVEDTIIDVAAPASNGQLENWDELFE